MGGDEWLKSLSSVFELRELAVRYSRPIGYLPICPTNAQRQNLVSKINCQAKQKCRQSFLCLHSLSDFVVIVNSPSLCQLVRPDLAVCVYAAVPQIYQTNVGATGMMTAVRFARIPTIAIEQRAQRRK